MFLKDKYIIFKIRRSKVTDYAALNSISPYLEMGAGEFWLFTSASALVLYVSKLPLGVCSIRACSISKLRKRIDC